jgi:hypothetical protein
MLVISLTTMGPATLLILQNKVTKVLMEESTSGLALTVLSGSETFGVTFSVLLSSSLSLPSKSFKEAGEALEGVVFLAGELSAISLPF